MQQAKTMTLEEEVAIGLKALELKKQGKLEESLELQKKIPLQPYIAKIVKDYFGADNLIKTGWNLSAAEAEFGPGWLNQ
jgi:hypothetical protein